MHVYISIGSLIWALAVALFTSLIIYLVTGDRRLWRKLKSAYPAANIKAFKSLLWANDFSPVQLLEVRLKRRLAGDLPGQIGLAAWVRVYAKHSQTVGYTLLSGSRHWYILNSRVSGCPSLIFNKLGCKKVTIFLSTQGYFKSEKEAEALVDQVLDYVVYPTYDAWAEAQILRAANLAKDLSGDQDQLETFDMAQVRRKRLSQLLEFPDSLKETPGLHLESYLQALSNRDQPEAKLIDQSPAST